MKRILSLTLALVMVLGTFTGVFAAEVTVEEEAGAFLESVGVLLGDTEGNLNLEGNLERRDAVILLSRLLGVEEEAAEFETSEETPSWEDARTDAYYVPFFAWAETNEYFEGDDEGNFNPRNAITAQEYALVLLRALGHEASGHEAWKAALETAEELGLLVDVEVENDDEVVRGQMAVMTLNALKTEMKDSDKTLAEELEIELPKPATIEVEDVYADNLKQVVVVFNNEVDEESATNLDNYTFAEEFEMAEVLEDGKTVVLTLVEDDELDNQKEYKLTVNDVLLADSDIKLSKVEKKFVAVDVTLPAIEEVNGLGTKALEVVFSEPVTKTSATKMTAYKIDDKVISGSIKYVYPNSVIISTNMTVGDHTLSVKDVEDFAEFKVQETGFEFTVVEDNEAPEIVSAKSNDLKEVEITFNEPVKSVSNGYHTSKANLAKKPIKISGNKVTLTFTSSMSLSNTTIYVDGVEDYSGNKADRTVVITPELDTTRPEVVAVDVEDGKEFTIAFSKEVDSADAIKRGNYVIKDADGDVPSGYGLNSKGNPITTIKYDDKEVTFELRSNLPKGSYTIEISGIQDTASIRNTMLPQVETFEVGDTGKPEIQAAWTEVEDELYQYVYVQFSEAVATEGDGNALSLVKYNYTEDYSNISWLPMPSKSTIDLVAEDTVRINLPKVSKAADLLVVDGIRVTLVTDLEGNYLAGLQDVEEVIKNNARTIALKSAKVTSEDTIEVTFTGKLESVSEADFRLVNTNVTEDAYHEVYFESFKNSAQTIAIFRTAEEVGEDVYGWKFETVEGTLATTGYFDSKLVSGSKVVTDAINPTYKEMKLQNNNEIVVTFNEEVKTNGIKLGLTVEVDGEEVAFSITNNAAGQLVITLTEAPASGDDVRVVLEDINDITDKAGNSAEGFEDYIYVE